MISNLIACTVFLPLVGAILQVALPRRLTSTRSVVGGGVAIGTSLLAGVTSLVVLWLLRRHGMEPSAAETLIWIGDYSITYDLRIDGLNCLLVLLSALIFPILIAAEWGRKEGRQGAHGLLLVLQTAFVGAVCSQDLFLLFFFWALSAAPIYFLVGVFGGEGRERAAFHGIVSAAIGNALFFMALILIYYASQPHTFSISALTEGKLGAQTLRLFGSEMPVAPIAFGLIGAGLAFRAPIWPFHGWFIGVAEEAAPATTIVVSSISIPVAVYIFLRLSYVLFPEMVLQLASPIVVIGVVNVLMGSICAAAERGLRRLLAFTCMSELGLVLIGIGSVNSTALLGVVYQLMVFGLAIAGLMLFCGIMIERTGNSYFIDKQGASIWGGVAGSAPALCVAVAIFMASVLGIPGLSGFIGRALIFIGGFTPHPIAITLAVATTLVATYSFFRMFVHVFLGRGEKMDDGPIRDLSTREYACLFPLMAVLLFFGFYPKPLLAMIQPELLSILAGIK